MQRRSLLIHALGIWATLGITRGAWAAGYRVSTAQMQEALGQRFPRRYPVQGLLTLDVNTPRLQMLPDENRLRAEMPVEAAGPALNRSHQGSFDVDFGLRYEASDRTLRAHQLRLSRLKFPSLQPGVVALLNTYAPALADETLKEVVLHRLEPKDLAPLDAMGMQPGTITVTPSGLVVAMVLKPL
ncbi:MAG: DUF1439 domain-containing protein [Hydrogenophaga sp.]|uniref:DUF1439 domain-containing protein n=1 Tax=Hydrogenophaga sp. TaxID=1904254 RepID=UPI003D0B5D31